MYMSIFTVSEPTIIGVHDGEVGGDGGTPGGVQTTESHHDLQVT